MALSSRSKIGGFVAAIAIVAAAAAWAGVSLSSSSTSSTSSSTTTTLKFDIKHNARSDVSFTPCKNSNGAWVLNGALINSQSYSRKYQIIVDFVTTAGATVEDSAVVEVDNVAPGERRQWSATGAHGVSGISCVVRNVQAVAAS